MYLSAVLIMMLSLRGYGHMGITINDIFPREKATKGDAFRYPNGGVCDGTSAGTVQFTAAVGALTPGRTTFGAGHGGGHCAWFISEDQVTWYKINDKVDCMGATQPSAAGAGIHDLVIPASIPLSCGTKCVLGWFWSPRNSGGCEIYHDCFDIQVTGTITGVTTTQVKITTPLTCARVNGAGLTGMFGTVVGGGTPTTTTTTPPGTGGGTPTAAPATGTGCPTRTIISGDSLGAIATVSGVTLDAILAVNPQITNPDAISIGDIITIPPCSGGSNECQTYTVIAGDYVNKIASDKSITTQALLEINPQITDVNSLEIGDILNIPPCTTSTSTGTTPSTGATTPPTTMPPTSTGATTPPTTGTTPSTPSIGACQCTDQKTWCQTTGCNFLVQINQCWGSGPFFYCECKNGDKPRHSVSNPVCTTVGGRNAQDVCSLPSSCVAAAVVTTTCSDGIQNGQETGIDCGGSCPACQTYQWKLQNWGSCSTSCGPGTQTRSVTCVDANGNDAPGQCGTQPTTSQYCNTQTCSQYVWKSDDYEDCNVQCGKGQQFRKVYCENSISPGVVASALCNLQDMPAESQVCTGSPEVCPTSFYWMFGDWQYCDGNCIGGGQGGTQYRELFCYTTTTSGLTSESDCDQTMKPLNSRPCQVQCQNDYTWKTCPMTDCSSSCRGKGTTGFQERQVLCTSTSSGIYVDDSMCDLSTKPPSFLEGCNQEIACSSNYWVAPPFGPCVSQTRTRIAAVICIKVVDGTSTVDSDCKSPKPSSVMDCSLFSCVELDDIGNGSPNMATTSLFLTMALSIFVTLVTCA